MKVRYAPGASPVPLPSLGGGRQRYRPLLAVRITGPAHSLLRDTLIDTGADDTVFPEGIAVALGVDLASAPQLNINLAGRGPIRCRYAQALLRITDGAHETYEWTATIGFVPVSLKHPLLGHAGFLQFFNADFRGADREVILTTNPTFPGRRI